MSDIEPTVFSYQSTKRLIQMVQDRPCLWNKKKPEYKDRLAKDHAWAEIFEELDPAFKTANATLRHEISVSITKKWCNIRDSYVKSLKPEFLGRRNRPYIHSELLRFLDDRYFEKMQKCRDLMPQDEPQDEVETETEAWDHEVFVSIDENELNPSKRLKVDEDCLKEKPKEDEDIVSVLANLIRKEEDEDTAFFKSITPSVKKLTEDSKFTFRIEVLKLIRSLRVKDRNLINFKSELISNNDSESE